MIGNDAFCPKSGAPLSRESHYDERGRPKRAVEDDKSALAIGTAGELTNGAVRSSRTALLSHFKRCHTRHEDPDDQLYRSASLALKRLKSTADGRQGWDVYVWYALKRRLDRRGYAVEWMDGHTALWCPDCHSKLRYTSDEAGALRAWCGVGCTTPPPERLTEIRELVAALYRTAFEDDAQVDPSEFLQT